MRRILVLAALLSSMIVFTILTMPALAEEAKPIEYDRSIMEKLKIVIEVDYRRVPGGFNDEGNWVIRYAVEKYHDEEKYRELYASTLRALQVWNASLRYYADRYNCSHLKKIILKFAGEADEVEKGESDILVKIDVPRAHAWGTYYLREKIILISPAVPTHYIYDVVMHEIAHSLGLGHYQVTPARLIDPRGNYYELGEYELAHQGLPSLIELYALCKLYEPIKYRVKPYLSGVIELPREMNRDYYIGLGVIQVFSTMGDVVVTPPTFYPSLYSAVRDMAVRDMAGFPVSDLELFGLGLYGGDVIIYPLRHVSRYHVDKYAVRTIYIAGVSPPYTVLRDYGGGVLEAVVDFNISKAVYGKTYILNERGSLKQYLLGELPNLETIRLPGNLSWNHVRYIVTIGEEKCGVGECYDLVDWLDDGRILVKNVREDLIVKVEVGKVYSFNLDIPFFNYNYTVDSPKRLRYMFYYDGVENATYAPEGSVIYVKPEKIVHDPGNGTKILLSGWSAGSWNGSHLTILLDKPIEVKAYIIREHQVSVESPIGRFTGVGWALEGSEITVYPEEEIVDFGNGTRMVFRGFEGYEGKNITLKVTEPVKLKALWTRQHRVTVESRYFTNVDTWVNEGEAYFALARKEGYFENGTYVYLKSFNAYIGEEVVEAEDLGDSVRLIVDVEKPVIFKALWDTYYMVELSSDVSVESSSPGLYLEGSRWNASAEEAVVYGNGTIRRFNGWIVDGELLTDMSISLTVSKPLNVKALWKTYDYVTFMLDAGGGYIIQADKVVLERVDGLAVVNGSGLLERGLWKVSQAWYKDVEVSKPVEVIVKGPGAITLPSKLRSIAVKVSDIFSVPAPSVSLQTAYYRSVSDWAGLASLYAIPPVNVRLEAVHLFGRTIHVVEEDSLVADVKIPLSPYTLAATIAGAAATGYLYLRRRGKSGG